MKEKRKKKKLTDEEAKKDAPKEPVERPPRYEDPCELDVEFDKYPNA